MARTTKDVPTQANDAILDDDAIATIRTVSEAVSSAAGLAAEDARRHAVLAHVRGSWNRGRRLPLDLVSAGMSGTCP